MTLFLSSKTVIKRYNGCVSAEHTFILPKVSVVLYMRTGNPSDPKNTKTGVDQLHGLPPCLLASRNLQHNLHVFRGLSKNQRRGKI